MKLTEGKRIVGEAERAGERTTILAAEGDTNVTRYTLYLDPTSKALADAMAKEAGISISAWFRRLIQAARRESVHNYQQEAKANEPDN